MPAKLKKNNATITSNVADANNNKVTKSASTKTTNTASATKGKTSKKTSSNNGGKGKKANSSTANKKKDKLSYGGMEGLDIMAEFSERNRDIIVKFPLSCMKNTYGQPGSSNNVQCGNLEYNPNIIDPLPISDSSQHTLVGQSIITNPISSDTNNIPLVQSNDSTNLTDFRREIYDKYITAGSNATLNLQNLIMTQQSLAQKHNAITGDVGSTGMLLSTPISACFTGGVTRNLASINTIVANDSMVGDATSAQHLSGDTSMIPLVDSETVPVGINRYQKKIDDLLSEFATPEKKRAMTQIEILLHQKYNQTKQIELMYSMCQYVNTYNQWPKSCTSACLWDSHEFPYMPWGIPESYDMDTGKFSLSGIFCSPNCALAYLMHEERNTGSMWEKISLLNLLYHKVYQGVSPDSSMDNNSDLDESTTRKTKSAKTEIATIDAMEGLTQLEKRRRKNMIKYRSEIRSQNSSTTWGNENLVPAPDRITLRKFGGPLTIEQFRCLTINNDKRYQVVFPPCDFVAPVLEETKKVFTQESNFIPVDTNYINRIETELKIKRTKPISTPKIGKTRNGGKSAAATPRVSIYNMPAAAASR